MTLLPLLPLLLLLPVPDLLLTDLVVAALKDADALIHDILRAVDTSKDGLIQYSEFRNFFVGAERELWRIFKSVDSDGNGKIDRGELQAALAKAGIAVQPPQRLDTFFAMIDLNSDGGELYRKLTTVPQM